MAMESSANVPGSLLASHDSTNSHASSSKMLLDDSPPSLDPRPSTSQPTEDHDTTSAAAAVLPPSPPLSLPSLSKPRASAFPTSLSDFRLHSPACSPAASSSSSSGALSSYAFPSSSATTPAPSAAPLGPTNLPTPTPTQDAGSASSSSDDSATAYLATPTPASSSTFRRKTPSASAIIAGRFRRSSMLGREVTPDLLLDEAIDEAGPTKEEEEEEEEAHDGSLEDADMRSFDEDNGAAAGPSVSPVPARTPSPHPSTTAIGLSTASARRHTTSTTPLLSAQRRFTASSSPSSTPGATESDSVSTRHTPGRTLAGRRMAGRKTGPLFRDRSVLRVAASLCDESSPADSEIASEAKLQRRVKSDCAASPRSSISSTSHQYFQPHLAPGQPWPKNCDLEDGGNPYVELAGGDHLDFEEDISSMSSDDDDIADEDGVFGGSARGFARAGMRRRPGAGSDAEVEMSYDAGTGATTIPVPNGKGKNSTAGASATAAADGSAPSGSDTTPLSTSMPTLSNLTKKGAQWTNFRASPRARSSARTSPGVERIFHHRPRTPGAGSTHVGAAAAATAAAIASAASPSSTSSGMMLVDTSTSSISSNSTDMLQHQQQQQQAVLNAIAGGLSPRLVSPSMWTFARQQHVGGKRKFGGGASDHERFEPYATSAAKRRAVSPIAYLAASAAASSANGGSNSTSSSSTSPALSALSGTGPVPVPILALNTSMNAGSRGPDSSSAASSPLGGAVSVNGLPLPTPLSMPSPTNPLIQPFWNGAIPHHYHPYHPHHPNHHHRTLSGPYGRSASAFATAAAASSSSRSGSPATRPSTPTNLLGPGGANGNKSGAGGAAAAAGTTTTLAASSASASSVPSVTFREIVSMGLASPSLLATQTPGSAGSGPGYGSMPAALGLSLGGNSAARVKDEEEEEGSREGMDEGVRMLGLS